MTRSSRSTEAPAATGPIRYVPARTAAVTSTPSRRTATTYPGAPPSASETVNESVRDRSFWTRTVNDVDV